ncbi:MAG: hypothetical protein EA411_13235 [Saprospirales bacterium]|nr:MAG: hypothetical protein EA411_13235 [Saprospirales bacterium]
MSSDFRHTIRHLRFPFSILLLPVFLFAASAVVNPHPVGFLLALLVLHLLVYPSSNGYNSTMDRDEGSIGGLKDPPPVPSALFPVTVIMDVVAVVLSYWWSPLAAWVLLAYILASRAYSWRGIRLKKYPIIGFLIVILFQGAGAYYYTICMMDPNPPQLADLPLQINMGMVLSSLMIASSYPLTQIYQHRQDEKDGVMTLSRLLGIRGTFIFSLIALIFFVILLFTYLTIFGRLYDIVIFLFCTLPVTVHFFRWFRKTLEDSSEVTYENSMKMSFRGALGMNLFFTWLLIASQLL